jgi:hypothetical protein
MGIGHMLKMDLATRLILWGLELLPSGWPGRREIADGLSAACAAELAQLIAYNDAVNGKN